MGADDKFPLFLSVCSSFDDEFEGLECAGRCAEHAQNYGLETT